MRTTALDYLPIWGLFLGTVVFVLLSIEVGYLLGRRRRQRSEDEKETAVGAVVAAAIGLLGLVLAFTFSLAASRFDARRLVLVEEANNIGTTYLRAGLLPDSRGTHVRKLLGKYVEARLEAAQLQHIEAALHKSAELHKELWKEAEYVGLQHPNSIVVGLFIEALNQTIDVHSKRVLIALQNRIPGALWATLYLVTLLTMAGAGYHEGLSKSKRSIAMFVLAITFSTTISAIADFDRPQEGWMQISQQTMLDLRTMMNDAP